MKPAYYPDVFTCTFCRTISGGPPRILGRSARLTCEPCYSALLDLSICWVCGEIIFRGDECVSLGWCFWHTACYGCLLCGNRLVCTGTPIHAIFENKRTNRHVSASGQEVAEAPLCAMCIVEVEAAGLEEEAVTRRGLKRVSVVDGGVTRERWAKKNDRQNQQATTSREKQPYGAAGVDMASGGSVPIDHAPVTAIWADIHDPINGYSFKPSPLKPIPWFMAGKPAVNLEHLPPIPRSGTARAAACDPRFRWRQERLFTSKLRHSEPGPQPSPDM